MSQPTNRMRTRVVAIAVLFGLVAACGSQRSDQELLEAAQPAAVSDGSTGAQQSGSTGDLGVSPDGGTASTAPLAGAGADAGVSGGSQPAAGGGGATNPGSTPSKGPATGPPIVIGSIGDYAGLVGAPAASMIPTLQTWARWRNDNGGINGRPVQFLFADAASDPARNLSIVRDMVERKGAVAFVHNQMPLSGSGSLNYLEEHQIPVIGGDQIAQFWNESPVLFPQGTGARSLFTGFAKLAAKAGKKIAILYCAEADFICGFGRRVMVDEGEVRRRGGEVVYQAQISIAQPSFTTECLQARDRGAEVLVIFSVASGVRATARSCEEQGYKPGYVTGSLAVTNELENVPALAGMHAPLHVFPWIANDTPGAKLFHQVMSTYGSRVTIGPDTAYAWTSAQLFAKVAQLAGTDVNGKTLLTALYSLRDETLDGLTVPLNFKPGQPTPAFDCYFEVALSEAGKYIAPQGSRPVCG